MNDKWKTMETKIQGFLSTAVPLYAQEIKEGKRATIWDVASRKKEILDYILEKGDQFFYGGKQTADVANAIAETIANLSFVQGGITTFGLHFENTMDKL